jgi:hypothetical protein
MKKKMFYGIDKRTDTVKAFLQKNKLGKYNEEEMKKLEAEKAEQEAAELELAKAIHVGDRCEVTVPKALPKRGLVSCRAFTVSELSVKIRKTKICSRKD